MGPLVPLVWTWDDSAAHGFQSQDKFIVGCALLSLAHNYSKVISGYRYQASNPDHSPLMRARYSCTILTQHEERKLFVRWRPHFNKLHIAQELMGETNLQ